MQCRLVAAAGICVLSAGMSLAQDFPVKPIRIVTTGAGGTGDFTSRLIAQGISGLLGQPVLVENWGGSPAEVVAEAPADGPPSSVD